MSDILRSPLPPGMILDESDMPVSPAGRVHDTWRDAPPELPPDVAGNLRARAEHRVFTDLVERGHAPGNAGLFASNFMGGPRSSLPLGAGVMDLLGPLSTPYDMDETIAAVRRYRETEDPAELIEAGLGILFMLPEAVPVLGGVASVGKRGIRSLMQYIFSKDP